MHSTNWNVSECEIKSNVKFGGGSIMVWGAMSREGVDVIHKIIGWMNEKKFVHP